MPRVSGLPSLGPRGEGWVVIQVVLLALIAASGWWMRPAWDGPAATIGLVAGLGLLAAGGSLAVRGIVDLRESLTPLPHPRSDGALIETGVYARSRHPIYGGLIVASLGWSLVMASAVALLLSLALAGFFFLKSTREEAWLLAHYPGYAEYRRRTRRFIPWSGGPRG